ncbi:MAG: hypothetical protein BWX72_00331 [Firmicutes bacterium ADurb.Bin080]|nr:MAG: hypothetical protein BWX72_00331 [Firmicutes bacterium ADurb.Bin080]
MPSNNQRNNKLEWTPTFGTKQTIQRVYEYYMRRVYG